MFQRHPIQNEAYMLVTTNTQDRKRIFENPAYAKEAVDSLYRVQGLYPFFLYAFVIMPDHIHLLLRVLEPGSVSKIMRIYKHGLTYNLGIGPFWQSRFHIRMPHDLTNVLHYIHWNPVKAGLCENPEDYPWSSACGKWDVADLPFSG